MIEPELEKLLKDINDCCKICWTRWIWIAKIGGYVKVGDNGCGGTWDFIEGEGSYKKWWRNTSGF